MEVIAEKQCTKCGAVKPVTGFNRNKRSRDGLESRCKSCARAVARKWVADNPERHRQNARNWKAENMTPELARAERLRRRHGITTEQWDALCAFQNDRCAGCGADEAGGIGRFHVDHDHDCCSPKNGSMIYGGCGKCVRGLLCFNCNKSNALVGRPYVDWSAVMEGVCPDV